jgi:hypothetical protein
VSGDGCSGDCLGRFHIIATPTAQNLISVGLVGSDVYVTGVAGLVMKFEGSTWTTMSINTPQAVQALWGTSASDIHVGGGGGTLFHWNGSSWVDESPGTQSINAIWGPAANEIYAVGSPNTVLHYTGSTWMPLTTCFTNGNSYRAVWGTGSSNVFAAGNEGVCHWNGLGWAPVDTSYVNDLAGSDSPTSIYTIDNTMTLRRSTDDGATWTPIPVPGTIQSIAVTAPGHVLGVGASGVILELDDTGTQPTWTHLVSPTTLSLISVAGTSPTNAFIAGQAGIVLH